MTFFKQFFSKSYVKLYKVYQFLSIVVIIHLLYAIYHILSQAKSYCQSSSQCYMINRGIQYICFIPIEFRWFIRLLLGLYCRYDRQYHRQMYEADCDMFFGGKEMLDSLFQGRIKIFFNLSCEARDVRKFSSQILLEIGKLQFEKMLTNQESNISLIYLIRLQSLIKQISIKSSYLMAQRSYLTNHPQLVKKYMKKSSVKQLKIQIDHEQLTRELIENEEQRIKDLEFQIKAFKIQVDLEQYAKIDYSKEIKELQEQLQQIRDDEKDILVQIENCRLIENHVNPLEYYLWKKKQRINTYDASIAQLYREIQAQRQYFQHSLEEYRGQNEDLIAEIQELEQKIGNFGNMPKEEDNQQVNDEQHLNQLFRQNIILKQQYNALLATSEIINQNRQIIGLQVADNIETIQSTLRSYFEQQKAKLTRQFKQIQSQVKSSQVVPINRDDQSYSIEPLFDDYTYKLKELQNVVPESMKKIVHPVLVPLPWASFNWRQFLGTNKNSQQIYNQFNQLQQQCIRNEAQALQLQAQIKKIDRQLTTQKQKSNEISINILKLKNKLQS